MDLYSCYSLSPHFYCSPPVLMGLLFLLLPIPSWDCIPALPRIPPPCSCTCCTVHIFLLLYTLYCSWSCKYFIIRMLFTDTVCIYSYMSPPSLCCPLTSFSGERSTDGSWSAREKKSKSTLDSICFMRGLQEGILLLFYDKAHRGGETGTEGEEKRRVGWVKWKGRWGGGPLDENNLKEGRGGGWGGRGGVRLMLTLIQMAGGICDSWNFEQILLKMIWSKITFYPRSILTKCIRIISC